MRSRTRYRAVALVAVALVTTAIVACGGGGKSKLDKAMENVTDDQLAVMVLPQDALGPDAADLQIDPSSGAGFIDADTAAGESPDPDDTGADLEAAGRVNGYELTYADYGKTEGAAEVDSSVELYTTEDTASAALSKLARDFQTFSGPDYAESGFYFEDVQTEQLDGIGDAALYFSASFTITDPPEAGGGHTSAVVFRLGRLDAFVSQVRFDSEDIKSPLQDSARTMAQRIKDVLLGDLEATPVPIPSEEDAAAAQIQAVLDDIAGAFNGKDVEGYAASWTDNGFMDAFGVTREEALSFLNESIGEPPIEFRDVTNVEFTDNGAAFDVDFVDGVTVKHARLSIIDEGNGPQIDGVVYLTTAIPEGTTAIDLALAEFAFVFDADATTGGNVAFNITNSGQQQHEVVIEKVPDGLDIAQAYQQAFQSEVSPEGTESFAYAGPFDAGASSTLVFSQPLEPGRYALLCFIPDAADPDGTPHLLKGMVGEFTVAE